MGIPLLFVVLLPAALAAEDAASLMAQVAANVEKATDARRQFVYEQKVRSSLVRSSGEMSRWERRQYTALPTPSGTDKKLVSFEGEYRKDGRMHKYSEPGFQYKDTDIDGDLIDDLTDDLVNDKEARDGIPHSLFPLRTSDLSRYRFTLKGETVVNGRRAHEIAFEPDRKLRCAKDDEKCRRAIWKGVAVVDAEELQPVRISTDLALSIPWAVRAFLGTNLKQTGFSITYARVAENVWFPLTYGTEFRFSLLWGYKRTVTLSLESSGFRRADVNSTVQYDTAAAVP